MAEEFTLQDPRTEGAAVYGHERATDPKAVGVECPGEKLFPRPDLSIEDNRAIQGSYFLYLLIDLKNVDILSDDVLKTEAILDLLSQREVFFD